MEALELALSLVTAVPFTSARMHGRDWISRSSGVAAAPTKVRFRAREFACTGSVRSPAGGCAHGKKACDVVLALAAVVFGNICGVPEKKSRGASFALAAASLRTRWAPRAVCCAAGAAAASSAAPFVRRSSNSSRLLAVSAWLASQGVAVCLL